MFTPNQAKTIYKAKIDDYCDRSSAGTASSEFIVSISDLKDEIETDKYKVFT